MTHVSQRQKNYRPCECGSGRHSVWQYTKDNKPLARTCPACHIGVMDEFRKRGFEVDDDPTRGRINEYRARR